MQLSHCEIDEIGFGGHSLEEEIAIGSIAVRLDVDLREIRLDESA